MTSPDSEGAALVVGYGNILRGDDAIGWRAVEAVAARSSSRSIRTLAVHQLTFDLVDLIRRARAVVFIDAVRDTHAGQIVCRPVARHAGQSELGHRTTPAALVAMAETLFDAQVEAWEVLVGGKSFEFGQQLSCEVEEAVPQVVDVVLNIVGEPHPEKSAPALPAPSIDPIPV